MNRLKELRVKSNLTLRQLNELVDINYSQLGRIENGKSSLYDEHIKSLTDFFGVSADYLLGLSDNPVPRKINYYQEIPNQQKLTLEQVLSRFTNNEVMIVYTDDLITIIEEPHKLNRKIFKFEKIK